MKRDQVFPSKYLKASDLQGREIPVTVSHVELIKMNDDQKKPVMFFEGKEKGLVVNQTLWEMIEMLTGYGDTDDWLGQRFVLFPTTTKFRGQEVACIRVKASRGAARPAERESEPSDWQAPAPPPSRAADDDEIPF